MTKGYKDEDGNYLYYGYDEEDYYHIRKKNSRKSLAPLFVYLILTERTTPDKPLRQQEILDILRTDRNYEICLERKALSRIIHNLEESGLGIRSHEKRGVWYDNRW